MLSHVRMPHNNKEVGAAAVSELPGYSRVSVQNNKHNFTWACPGLEPPIGRGDPACTCLQVCSKCYHS